MVRDSTLMGRATMVQPAFGNPRESVQIPKESKNPRIMG